MPDFAGTVDTTVIVVGKRAAWLGKPKTKVPHSMPKLVPWSNRYGRKTPPGIGTACMVRTGSSKCCSVGPQVTTHERRTIEMAP